MQSPCEAFPMTGGNGHTSYANNSSYQRVAGNLAKEMLKEAIAEKLHLRDFPSTELFNIADLGCSVGPNTFSIVQLIIEAVEKKLASQGLSSCALEFGVFYNDHSSNDFNTLFTSLPPDRRYFAMGVPGSFHRRLFPKASLHFIHSSYALQWLSEVPREVLDKKSPAWNKGRIYYVGAPIEVVEAYANQFEKDLRTFLSLRAQEMVVGGMIALLLPGSEEKIEPNDSSLGLTFGLLGSALMDVANEGIIEEAKVDSFNLPMFSPCPQEFIKIAESIGCFIVEKVEIVHSPSKGNEVIDAKTIAMHLRAGLAPMISKHFGNKIVGEVFQRYKDKIAENSHLFKTTIIALPALIAILKRKA